MTQTRVKIKFPVSKQESAHKKIEKARDLVKSSRVCLGLLANHAEVDLLAKAYEEVRMKLTPVFVRDLALAYEREMLRQLPPELRKEYEESQGLHYD